MAFQFHFQSDKPLSEQEKLLADVIGQSHRIPCGGQIALELNLKAAISDVEKLFTEHNLPLKDELLGELKLWREHAEQGLKFSRACDRLMTLVVRSVDDRKIRSTPDVPHERRRSH